MTSLEELLKGRFGDATDAEVHWALRVAAQRYLAVHTLLGWVFATVGLAAIAGLVKRE